MTVSEAYVCPRSDFHPPPVTQFQIPEEESLGKVFYRDGYVIRDAEHPKTLDAIRHFLVETMCEYLGQTFPKDESVFLNNIHSFVKRQDVNTFRMHLYQRMNAQPWMRPGYFALARRTLEILVGNELAMQNAVNLTIQMPHDDSSTRGLHSDTHVGETPFQVVLWVPLVDVYDTKSMYLLSPDRSRQVTQELHRFNGGMAEVYESIKKEVMWLRVSYGQVLIFTPNLLHGNGVNQVSETRWALNARFTGLFTPYGDHPGSDKKLGTFYLPITPRVVTRIGMEYTPPREFEE